MKIIGLIVEYNPLHNGHFYYYNKVKELYPDSLIITIMSSEFSQRGDLCVFNKFLRAEQALKLGSDIVLSNPIYYSMNNASTFAYSNIHFLSLCNIDMIICGSESYDFSQLYIIYRIEQTVEFKASLENYLKEGMSFKSSFTKSLENFNINFKSNDLLNYFYYKAIKEINPNIELKFIKRINSNYNDVSLNLSNIQSATAIRKLNDISKFVPNFVNDDFKKYGFRDVNKLLPLIKYSLLNNIETRENVEGLGNKAQKIKCENYKDLINQLSTKRYSESKIKRFIISSLLNISSNESLKDSNYIRVLGFNTKGKEYLNKIKKNITIYSSIKEGINEAFDIEIKASKILDIIYNENLLKKESLPPKIVE